MYLSRLRSQTRLGYRGRLKPVDGWVAPQMTPVGTAQTEEGHANMGPEEWLDAEQGNDNIHYAVPNDYLVCSGVSTMDPVDEWPSRCGSGRRTPPKASIGGITRTSSGTALTPTTQDTSGR